MVKEEKTLNVKISKDLYKELKIQATIKDLSLKEIVEKALKLFLTEAGEDRDWNNLMKSLENAPEEEPDEIDLQIMERAKIEKARGEVEDYEDDLKELDNESPDN